MTKEQRQYNGKKLVFSTNGARTAHPHAKNLKKNSRHRLTSFTKINSKWITDLSVKHKTLKLLDDHVEENLGDPGYGDDFRYSTEHITGRKY